MNKAHFIKLLQKYLQGNATEAERQFLLSYYEMFNAEPDIEELLTAEQKQALKNQIRESIWERISQHEQKTQKVKSLDRGWTKYLAAAIFIFALSAAGAIFYINNKPQQQQTTVISTGLEKEQRLINLPDGSYVILKAGSKIDYAASFDGLAVREVHLEGDAYFDVKHDSLRPFIVHAGSLKTTVLGTSFNIKAWPADEDVSIAVTRGKVKVENQHKTFGTLVQDQQLTFYKEKADVVKTKADSSTHLSWKTQDILLDDVTITEASGLLENRFDVHIICGEEVARSERFTITILKNESLEQVLKSICEFNNATYTYDQDKGQVMIRKKE
ncbi:anti-FecI sigma factor FecR [Flammeovirgaceae bacterium 311]|nr:anti-FecI sigma factor FecR [Flammeovirgaceae bacterium 311]